MKAVDSLLVIGCFSDLTFLLDFQCSLQECYLPYFTLDGYDGVTTGIF